MANFESKSKLNFSGLRKKLREYRESYIDLLNEESESLREKLSEEKRLFFPLDVHKADLREEDLAKKVNNLKALKNLERKAKLTNS